MAKVKRKKYRRSDRRTVLSIWVDQLWDKNRAHYRSAILWAIGIMIATILTFMVQRWMERLGGPKLELGYSLQAFQIKEGKDGDGSYIDHTLYDAIHCSGVFTIRHSVSKGGTLIQNSSNEVRMEVVISNNGDSKVSNIQFSIETPILPNIEFVSTQNISMKVVQAGHLFGKQEVRTRHNIQIVELPANTKALIKLRMPLPNMLLSEDKFPALNSVITTAEIGTQQIYPEIFRVRDMAQLEKEILKTRTIEERLLFSRYGTVFFDGLYFDAPTNIRTDSKVATNFIKLPENSKPGWC